MLRVRRGLHLLVSLLGSLFPLVFAARTGANEWVWHTAKTIDGPLLKLLESYVRRGRVRVKVEAMLVLGFFVLGRRELLASVVNDIASLGVDAVKVLSQHVGQAWMFLAPSSHTGVDLCLNKADELIAEMGIGQRALVVVGDATGRVKGDATCVACSVVAVRCGGTENSFPRPRLISPPAAHQHTSSVGSTYVLDFLNWRFYL